MSGRFQIILWSDAHVLSCVNNTYMSFFLYQLQNLNLFSRMVFSRYLKWILPWDLSGRTIIHCVSEHMHAHALVLSSFSLIYLAMFLVPKHKWSDLEEPMTDSSLIIFCVINDWCRFNWFFFGSCFPDIYSLKLVLEVRGTVCLWEA